MKKHDDENFKDISKLLKQAMPPVNAEPRRDLWPAMQHRLSEGRPAHVPWYDWAVAGSLVAAVAIFPQVLLLLAYHL